VLAWPSPHSRWSISFKEFAVLDEGSHRKRFRPAVFDLDKSSLAALLRGLFTPTYRRQLR